MPLERFIPKSPDPFIRNSQDFEVAKFGHLNTIIEYVNTYVVTDSLQLAGIGPLTSTARYITDSLGNASSLAISTVNIGIGTTTPGAALEIYGGVDTLGISGPANQAKSIQIARYNNSSFQSHYIGDDGGAFFGSGLTISASGSGSQIYLQVSAAGRNVNIGTAGQTLLPKDLGARLGVRGSGTTSATTAFLVQNSAGTTAFSIKDNGVTNATYIEGGMCWFNNINSNGIVKFGSSLSVGFNTDPTATVHIVGANNLSTGYAVKVFNSVGQGSLSVTNDGVVQIGDISTAGYPSVLAIMRNSGTQRGTTFTQNSTALIIQNFFGGVTYQNTPITIIGSGSTSATTSLLVQNSAGNNTLQVLDDASVIINGNNTSTSTLFRANNSSGNYAIKTMNNYRTDFGYFGNTLGTFLDTDVSSAFRAGWPSISPSWYAGYFTCAGGDVRVGQATNGTNANPSAILQCNTTTQGFLPPRMTTAQRTAIVSPAAGLIVYDTTTNKSYTYDGTAWQAHW